MNTPCVSTHKRARESGGVNKGDLYGRKMANKILFVRKLFVGLLTDHKDRTQYFLTIGDLKNLVDKNSAVSVASITFIVLKPKRGKVKFMVGLK